MTNKIHSQNKIQVLAIEEDLNWCLDKLVNGWMRIIGIEPNFPEKKDWRWIMWLFQRWICFFLSFGVIVYLLMTVYLKKRGESDSSTENWNEWMDYVITSIQVISIHLCLLLVVSPNWNELRAAMNEAEYHLLNYPRAYPQIRKTVPFVIASLVLMVRPILFTVLNLKIPIST